jgi:hypothetical protein
MLVRIKEVGETPAASSPSRAFSNFFNAYAKAMNKAYGRTGALFQRPFRRYRSDDRVILRPCCSVYSHESSEAWLCA